MLDDRLIGTKCEKCINGHDLHLDYAKLTLCADCKDRPLRNKDKSRFEEDVKSEWLKELLDEEGLKGSPKDF